MPPLSEEDPSPFTEREQIVRSMGSVLGIRFSESDLSKETLEKIDRLAGLKMERKLKHAESWNYFSSVHRYWILFYLLLVPGLVLLPFYLTGIVFIGIDVLLYRWIRKRERTTPRASFDATELSKSYVTDLVDTYRNVKAELSARQTEKLVQGKETLGVSDFVGRAVWIEMDVDHSGTAFKPRKGIVVKVFTKPPSSREALVIELASPPFTFFPIPRRIRYLIAEYYQKWDSIQYTFDSGDSFVEFLRLKNRTVLKSQSYDGKHASRIGCGQLSLWPVPSSDEMFLRKQAPE